MLGAIIGAAGGLASSIFGKKSADKQAKLQKQFAQEGIQWRVADAKKAGIHPIYALGANTPTYTPVNTAFDGLAQAGQDLGRAIDANSNQVQRGNAFVRSVQKLQLQRLGLENELLSAQIARVRQTQQPPAPSPGDQFLIDGQPGSGQVVTKPLERESAHSRNTSVEAGTHTEMSYTRTPSGGYAPVMSKDAKDRLEEDLLGVLGWNIRNRLLPSFGFNRNPPDVELPAGYVWVFDPRTQSYVKAKRGPGGVSFHW